MKTLTEGPPLAVCLALQRLSGAGARRGSTSLRMGSTGLSSWLGHWLTERLGNRP